MGGLLSKADKQMRFVYLCRKHEEAHEMNG